MSRARRVVCRYWPIGALIILVVGTPISAQSAEVNVYSHRHYPIDRQLYNRFQQQSGIKVNVLNAKSDELIERIRAEGQATKADMIITVDVIRLERAKALGLLQPLRSSLLEANVPVELRDNEGYWYALTSRARVIIYNRRLVKAGDLSTYEDLAHPKWRQKIVMRSSSHPYNISLLSALIAHRGVGAALNWARGIAANLRHSASGNDRDQIRQVALGTADVTIANSYYVGLMINSESQRDQELIKSVAIYYPNQEREGTHINISGAAITRYAKNSAEARQLLEFLSSLEAQQLFASANHEIPVNPKVITERVAVPSSRIKLDSAAIKKLTSFSQQATKIVETTSWR